MSLSEKIAGKLRCGLIIARMVIHMNEARLTTIEQIEQIEQFLSASTSIEFSAVDDNGERYGHISRVLSTPVATSSSVAYC
jgi:hypothetical protein